MIKFDNVSKIYNEHAVALEGVTLEIQPGEFVSIVGQSGAGKSTFLKLLIAEEEPSSGRVFLDAIDVHQIPPAKLPILRRRIGNVFQDFKLLTDRTAFENVAFAMEVAGVAEHDIHRDVPKVLELVGLADKGGNFPRELSGGEKQRVAIARALAHRPDIIMADEPTGNLDPLNTWDIIRLLMKINDLGTTVILATHDREIINTIERRVVSLDRGRIVRDEARGRYIL
ncbi:cell division ATP-binding protein FtsE [Candidatus Parcubacteria bacterium]|nr:cell division ATP-binding protein FtsE [Candidatus Parcubacteria bacterium]